VLIPPVAIHDDARPEMEQKLREAFAQFNATLQRIGVAASNLAAQMEAARAEGRRLSKLLNPSRGLRRHHRRVKAQERRG
jgi:hypothetical protein